MLETPAPGDFTHLALFYRDDTDYAHGVGEFVERGLESNEPVFVSVPGGKIELLRDALGETSRSVEFADMTHVGLNPARIIPAITGFLAKHVGRATRFVGEPIWAERSAEEVVEATRHEALINVAFAGTATSILCPYDERSLGAHILCDAERTHPELISERGQRVDSTAYDPLEVYAAADRPLPEPSGPVTSFSTGTAGLGRFRQDVRAYVAPLLSPFNVGGFVVAASEVAANTLAHGDGQGTARIWHDTDEVCLEFSDRGQITDPLAGRRRPPADGAGGRGLWLVNQTCDLVELRSGAAGTVIRLHMRRS